MLVDEDQTLQLLEKQLILLQSEVSFLQEAQRELLAQSINEYKKSAQIDWHAIAARIADYTQASKELKIYTDTIAQPTDATTKSTISSSDYQALWKKLISKIETDQSNNP